MMKFKFGTYLESWALPIGFAFHFPKPWSSRHKYVEIVILCFHFTWTNAYWPTTPMQGLR